MSVLVYDYFGTIFPKQIPRETSAHPFTSMVI